MCVDCCCDFVSVVCNCECVFGDVECGCYVVILLISVLSCVGVSCVMICLLSMVDGVVEYSFR